VEVPVCGAWPLATVIIIVIIMVMRFQVLTAVNVMMTAFWDMAPCSRIQVFPTFYKCLLSLSSGR